MREFVALYAALDATTSTQAKVDAIAAYVRVAAPADAAWAVWTLLGGRPKRLLGVRRLATWAMESVGVAPWLFEACAASTGDLAEAIALLLPEPPPDALVWPSLAELGEGIRGLAALDEAAQRAWVLERWRTLPTSASFVLLKLMTGALRVGVSSGLVTRALGDALGVPVERIAERLMGELTPTPELIASLRAPAAEGEGRGARPYPFALATPVEGEVEALGDAARFLVEWKWDGIRCQVIRRGGETWLWSRGEERVTERFPELVEATRAWPDGTVLDGEVLAWRDDAPLAFAVLQTRLQRKTVGPKLLADAPVVFVAYDVLEDAGVDVRAEPTALRRARLERLVAAIDDPRVRLSPRVEGADWSELRAARATSRARGVEGLMLKQLDAPYVAGRHKGGFFKWKIAPLTADLVLTYAQPGSGKRSNLYTDYTFGAWQAGALVTVAKAYSGLDDAEIEALDRWIRRNTLEKFGPVRRVEPVQVFELAFEGISASRRHKAGIAVRFPRIARWRTDKPAAEAAHVDALRALADGDDDARA